MAPWGGSAPNETYTRSDGTRSGTAVCTQAKNAAVNDTSELADNRENDFAAGLNLVLKRDGGNAPTADLPMNSHKLTGLSQGTARTDSISLDQVQDGDLTYAEAGGTANAITLTTTPSCTPVEGMRIGFFAEFDNTAATTVNLNTGGAVVLQVAGAACIGGEVQNAQFHEIAFDGTQWQLANPLWANVTAIAGLTSAANKLPMFTGAGTAALVDRTDLGVPSGTKMLFQQSAAPTGWTKDTTHDNKALRVVSGTASSGGSVAFTTAFASQTPTGTVNGHALTIVEMPPHGHAWRFGRALDGTHTGGLMMGSADIADQAAYTGALSDAKGQQIGGTGGGVAHDHTWTGNAINFAVSYVDLIIATKN